MPVAIAKAIAPCFPALERRRRFTPGDVVYLANLCHDCRACFYACMYAPPHEFGVNIPKALAEVREQTYAALRACRGWCPIWPKRNAWLLIGATLVSLVFFVAVVARSSGSGFVAVAHGPGRVLCGGAVPGDDAAGAGCCRCTRLACCWPARSRLLRDTRRQAA